MKELDYPIIKPKPKIMIVEDEVIVAADIKTSLEELGYTVCAMVRSGEEAIRLAELSHPDLILMDIVLAGNIDGIDAAHIIQARQHVPIVFISAWTDEERLARAKLTYPYGYLIKPCHERELKVAIEMALSLAQVDAQRRQSEEKFSNVFHHAPILMTISTVEDGTLLEVNEKFLQVSGFTRDEVIGKTSVELGWTLPESRNRLIEFLRTHGRVMDLEVRLFTKDNRWLDFLYSAELMWLNNSERLFSIALDITDRKRAEEALTHKNIDQALLLDTMEAQVWYLKDIETYGSVNQAHADFIGLNKKDIENRKLSEFLPKQVADLCIEGNWRVFETKSTIHSEEWGWNSTGELRLLAITKTPKLDDTGNVEYVVCVAIDITEKKRAEEEKIELEARLRQSQKMEAIGTLAGGIAHDFNNILAAILGYSQLAIMDGSMGVPAKNYIEQVIKASERAKELVWQILSFSRRTEQEIAPIQITSIIKEAIKLLRATVPTTIEIRHNIDDLPMTILADPTKIHQVLMNLCANAAFAMQDKGGVLEISLEEIEADGRTPDAATDIAPGRYLALAIRDTGHGIPPEVVDRIFEPFFTTKNTGEGTGMGLSVVYGIVKEHNGTIKVDSEVGKGSTFTIYLPLIESKIVEKQLVEPLMLLTGTEHILFVDDEETLTILGTEMLSRLGYRVTSATSSLEAFRIFRGGPDQFDLVITDQTMPNMTGIELAQEIMNLSPKTPIILCTGYSEQLNEGIALGMGIKRFLMKPLDIKDLAETVRVVLNE